MVSLDYPTRFQVLHGQTFDAILVDLQRHQNREYAERVYSHLFYVLTKKARRKAHPERDIIHQTNIRDKKIEIIRTVNFMDISL